MLQTAPVGCYASFVCRADHYVCTKLHHATEVWYLLNSQVLATNGEVAAQALAPGDWVTLLGASYWTLIECDTCLVGATGLVCPSGLNRHPLPINFQQCTYVNMASLEVLATPPTNLANTMWDSRSRSNQKCC